MRSLQLLAEVTASFWGAGVFRDSHALQEPVPPNSLFAWLVDGAQNRAAPFSSSSAINFASVSEAERQAAEKSSAESGEQFNQHESAESATDAQPAREDPYAELTDEQLRRTLLEKDKVVASSTAQVLHEASSLLCLPVADARQVAVLENAAAAG